MDVTVHMIYDGEKGDIINQYVTFTKIFDEQVKKHGLTDQAVRKAIRICKDRDVLKEYLSGRESEVVDLMITLFSQEEIWDMHVRSREKEAAEEAAVRTMIEEGRYFGASREATVERLREKFNLSQDDADNMVKSFPRSAFPTLQRIHTKFSQYSPLQRASLGMPIKFGTNSPQ